jgi:Peptidase M60, enhancin and enhancin-like/N-terminal domain of M60-like peptidases
MGTFLLLLTALASAHQARSDEADRARLLEGVAEIMAPGIPGTLCIFGDTAFPVVVGKVGGDGQAPVCVASRLGRGRVVAFGHDGYASAAAVADEGTGKLYANAIGWAAGDAQPSVAIYRRGGMAQALRDRGFAASDVDGPEWWTKLDRHNVLIADLETVPAAALPAIAASVKSGRGLIASATAWGWLQLNPGKELSADSHGNALLAPAGIIWTDGTLDRTSPNGFATATVPSELTNASRALDAVERHASGEKVLSAEELSQATTTLISAAHAMPASDTLLLPRLKALQAKHAATAVPTDAKPLTAQMPLERLSLTLEIDEMKRLPADRITAHPAGSAFPGAVPADAPRIARSVTLDTRVAGWRSTGLYAAPGELIEVAAPEAAQKGGLAVRIGCHTDGLWHLDAWKRAPEITREFAIGTPVTKAANPFGGPVYVVIPSGCRLGTIEVGIRGAVEAPHFVLGRTDPTSWRAEIRNRPAPWAELESSKVVLSVPSSVARSLDNPSDLMDWWVDVLDSCAELAGWPLERERPERYVCDLQISAGYMHSGYPIMTLLDVAPLVVDLAKLQTQGTWGHFHEMGHNHQSGDWTFDGTGEVTENLFSMYCFDRCCSIRRGGHPAIAPEAITKTMDAYFAKGTDFGAWKANPFLGLIMYIQLQEAFGWEAYRKVFAEYRALPDPERPKSDDEKRDQWMVRFSRNVGRNLGPFFQAWGVPTSEQARASVADLPAWMPEGFPPKGN